MIRLCHAQCDRLTRSAQLDPKGSGERDRFEDVWIGKLKEELASDVWMNSNKKEEVVRLKARGTKTHFHHCTKACIDGGAGVRTGLHHPGTTLLHHATPVRSPTPPAPHQPFLRIHLVIYQVKVSARCERDYTLGHA